MEHLLRTTFIRFGPFWWLSVPLHLALDKSQGMVTYMPLNAHAQLRFIFHRDQRNFLASDQLVSFAKESGCALLVGSKPQFQNYHSTESCLLLESELAVGP